MTVILHCRISEYGLLSGIIPYNEKNISPVVFKYIIFIVRFQILLLGFFCTPENKLLRRIPIAAGNAGIVQTQYPFPKRTFG